MDFTKTTGDLSPDILRFLRYLSFRADCLREQQANPLTIDLEKAQRHYDELSKMIEEKTEALAEVMPNVPNEIKNKPKNPYKKDGSYSEHGKKWYQLLKKLGLPENTEGPVVSSWKKGNPQSTQQIKDWLYSLNWQPCTFKYERNKLTGDERRIPQVRYVAQSDPRKGQLTESVLRLKDREPAVEILEGLTVAQHRRGIFEGFLSESSASGKCVASAGGLTNTLRLKHRKPIVNLPGVDAAWGKEIRGCIVAPEPTIEYVPTNLNVEYSQEDGKYREVDHVLCGADIVSLESSTKRHLMWPHDPEYVTEMSKPGFDEHINLAKFAGAVTQEDEDRYSRGEGQDLKPIRSKFKPANYAGVYGIGAKGLSRQTGMSERDCGKLLKAYWERNWAVKKVAEEQYVKTLKDGSMWLKNPVSGFYYSLRYEKDIFSTLNQGTGVFIFDSWVMRMRKKGINPQLSYHDEVLFAIPKGQEEQAKEALEEAMREVNESLKLNVTIGVDCQFGRTYSECH